MKKILLFCLTLMSIVCAKAQNTQTSVAKQQTSTACHKASTSSASRNW